LQSPVPQQDNSNHTHSLLLSKKLPKSAQRARSVTQQVTSCQTTQPSTGDQQTSVETSAPDDHPTVSCDQQDQEDSLQTSQPSNAVTNSKRPVSKVVPKGNKKANIPLWYEHAIAIYLFADDITDGM